MSTSDVLSISGNQTFKQAAGGMLDEQTQMKNKPLYKLSNTLCIEDLSYPFCASHRTIHYSIMHNAVLSAT